MDKEELDKIIENHKLWLDNDSGKEANLRGANLRDVNLRDANLRDANLRDASLRGANLMDADLLGTCLDHTNIANADTAEFEKENCYVIGYRTRKCPHIHKYLDGRVYSADFFSTCTTTECHPGLYLWPTLEMAKKWDKLAKIIKVKTKPEDVHKAGKKWRCRWFEVLGSVKDY